MALVLGAGISCTCAASDSTEAVSEEDVSTTESVEETTTNDIETSVDSSLAKLEAVDKSEVAALGLSGQQLSEAFAFAAYDINENYLKPNNLSIESISWENVTPLQWSNGIFYATEIYFQYTDAIDNHTFSTYTDLFNNIKEANSFSTNELLLSVEDLFRYCSKIDNYDLFDFVRITDVSDMKDLLSDNLIFSDDRMKLGEKVAQEISELEAK